MVEALLQRDGFEMRAHLRQFKQPVSLGGQAR
jgi:hypothetical protein